MKGSIIAIISGLIINIIALLSLSGAQSIAEVNTLARMTIFGILLVVFGLIFLVQSFILRGIRKWQK